MTKAAVKVPREPEWLQWIVVNEDQLQVNDSMVFKKNVIDRAAMTISICNLSLTTRMGFWKKNTKYLKKFTI